MAETTIPPGASCRIHPERPCDVDEWHYATNSVHPRMYGRCKACDAAYVFVLPRRRQNLGDAETFDVFLGNVRRAAIEQGREHELIEHAVEVTLSRGGVAQRLWWLLHSEPIRIEREIVQQIRHEVKEAFDTRLDELAAWMKAREATLNELTSLVSERIAVLDDTRRKLTKRAMRGAVAQAAADLDALRAKIAEGRRDLAGVRAELAVADEALAAKRAAAHREPLPVPAEYVPPAIAPQAVLCDRLLPPELVYALVDPADPELVRYVGRTNDPITRYRGHHFNGADAVTAWVAALADAGRRPTMVLLERCASDDVAARETYWIHHYRDRFQADLNRTIPRRGATS